MLVVCSAKLATQFTEICTNYNQKQYAFFDASPLTMTPPLKGIFWASVEAATGGRPDQAAGKAFLSTPYVFRNTVTDADFGVADTLLVADTTVSTFSFISISTELDCTIVLVVLT